MSQMRSDTLTIALDGEVSLDDFAAAMTHFCGLVDALTEELGQGSVARWVIDQLSAGSALATARAIPATEPASPPFLRVIEGYLEVGRALEQHGPVPYSLRVEREAEGLLRVLPNVESIRFETIEDEAVLAGGTGAEQAGQLGLGLRARTERHRAFGAVRGRIQTLSSRGQLHFTLYDTLRNRAISCYLSEGQAELMRHAWDQVALVEGLITRDATGRPLSVRQVRHVRVLAETGPYDYLQAKGALTVDTTTPAPEDVLRQLRDAG